LEYFIFWETILDQELP